LINKIEDLRNELNSSKDPISIIDYGAGSPVSNLADGEMAKGRINTTSVGKFCKSVSKSYKWAFLLFKLIRAFKPSKCLELGTACGISTSYQLLGLHLNNLGKIITLEGADSLASLANRNFKQLGLNSKADIVIGNFKNTLKEVLQKNSSFDFVFIDGHHDEMATQDYFQQILPHLSSKAIIVFDDISWSYGMQRAWSEIKKCPNLGITIDLFNIGICVFYKKKPFTKKQYKILL